MHEDIQNAIQVIETEIKGLKALEDALDENFVKAVDLIQKCTGKVVISGMGKSGHIATKIAATFASTGTPAIFVHPSEASHGDLGMITKADVVILLSNSGETAELRDIVFYCKRFSIPLIAIVRRKTSMLVESSDISFILPEIAEASPVAAPTTSTTMMLVWGDALAMCVMSRKGFSKEDFGIFHPGGKLGSQFLLTSALMSKDSNLPLVSPSAPMSDVLITMTHKSLGCAIVVDGQNKLLGIITDGDLRRHMSENIIALTAQDIMHKNPHTITPNTLAVAALGMMNERSVTSLIVADKENTVQGILHIHHILNAGIS